MKKLDSTEISFFLDRDGQRVFMQIREKIDDKKSRIYRLILNLVMWNENEVEDSIEKPLNVDEFYSK